MTQEKPHQDERRRETEPRREEHKSASKTDAPVAPRKRAPSPGMTSWPGR